jgi:hypothetical protein
MAHYFKQVDNGVDLWYDYLVLEAKSFGYTFPLPS